MTDAPNMGVRRFGAVNWRGALTLAGRENRRFLAIWMQTIGAPLITAGLFLTVFALAVGPDRGPVMGVPFLHFMAPGVLMMTVIQNAFANTSSSLLVAKIQGNIVDTLMPPLSAAELVFGYIAGGVGRGVLVSLPLFAVMAMFLGTGFAHPIWAFLMVVLGSAFMSTLGLITAIFSEKWDQQSAITNFIVTPLSFLSGTFYSIERLPPVMQTLSHINPVFYLIDGVRYGVIGQSDSNPWIGLLLCLAMTTGLMTLCWHWFRTGYRLKP